MLIEKRNLVAINDVITIKLVSGEEIVGKLLEQTDSFISLGKPTTVSLQPVSPQQMGLSFLPVLGSVDPDVTLHIPTSAIAVRPVKSNKSITSSYIQMTSGLLTPGAGDLIT